VSELQPSEHTRAAEGPRVPVDAPWGMGEAATLFVTYIALQLVLLALIRVEEALVGQMIVATASGLLILTLIGLFLTVRSNGRVPVRRLVGLKRPGWAALKRSVKPLVFGAVVYVAVSLGWDAVLRWAGRGAWQVPVQPVVRMIGHTRSPTALVFAFVVAVLLAPVVEEVLFRAVLYLPMRRLLGVAPAALVVSTIFALAHGYVWGVPQLLVLSLTFVALFERSGTLLAPIVAHGAYNAVQLVIVLSGALGAAAGP